MFTISIFLVLKAFRIRATPVLLLLLALSLRHWGSLLWWNCNVVDDTNNYNKVVHCVCCLVKSDDHGRWQLLKPVLEKHLRFIILEWAVILIRIPGLQRLCFHCHLCAHVPHGRQHHFESSLRRSIITQGHSNLGKGLVSTMSFLIVRVLEIFYVSTV